MAKKIGTNSRMMVGRDMTTAIGRIEIPVTIIEGMISMMITEGMLIVEMIIVGIIVTGIIRQEMTEGLRKVIDIMIIEGGIIDRTIVDIMTIKDLKDLDSFNIILRVKILPNHRMFGNQCMRREKLVD